MEIAVTIIFIILFILILAAIGFVVYKILNSKGDDKNKNRENNKNEKYYHTTQDQLPFEFIRMGVVKLKNNIYAKVVEVTSINTHLMEEDERESVREIWGSILNALQFDYQIYKQSRLVDIKEYLSMLQEKEHIEKDQRKAEGLRIYRTFVSDLVRENSVQTKKDYIVIPFKEIVKKKEKEDPNSLKKYRKDNNDVTSDEMESIRKQKEFNKALKTLNQREKVLEKQLRRLGITIYPLNDKELFELFYTTYNKERSNIQSMKGVDPSDYTTMYVKRGGV